MDTHEERTKSEATPKHPQFEPLAPEKGERWDSAEHPRFPFGTFGSLGKPGAASTANTANQTNRRQFPDGTPAADRSPWGVWIASSRP